MLRKASEAVPEGNDPAPQKEQLGSGQSTMEDVYRMMKEAFDRWDNQLDEISDEMNKRLTRLEHETRQPRLAIEADGPADKDSRGHGGPRNSSTSNAWGWLFCTPGCTPPKHQLDQFGVKAEPPALPCKDDSVVGCSATVSESCLPSSEMRSSIAAGGLVPTGEASTASETTLNEPPLRFYPTEETDLEPNCKKTSTPFASFKSSSFF